MDVAVYETKFIITIRRLTKGGDALLRGRNYSTPAHN